MERISRSLRERIMRWYGKRREPLKDFMRREGQHDLIISFRPEDRADITLSHEEVPRGILLLGSAYRMRVNTEIRLTKEEREYADTLKRLVEEKAREKGLEEDFSIGVIGSKKHESQVQGIEALLKKLGYDAKGYVLEEEE